MARTANTNEALVGGIVAAREAEREAIRLAKIKYDSLIAAETSVAHDNVLQAVRKAVFDGMSTRQIGFAYGSSDPHTAKRIVEEAMAGFDVDQGDHKTKAGWIVTVPENDNSLFTIQVYGLGDNKADGVVEVSMDEDEINFTAQGGDYWVVSQLYRQGLVDAIIKSYWLERNKRNDV